jgi:hypothetical protein
MGCANVAHAFAGIPGRDRSASWRKRRPNVAIVTAYNDVLSAHAPLAHYPDILKDEARRRRHGPGGRRRARHVRRRDPGGTGHGAEPVQPTPLPWARPSRCPTMCSMRR